MRIEITVRVDFKETASLKLEGDADTLIKAVKAMPTLADIVGDLSKAEKKDAE